MYPSVALSVSITEVSLVLTPFTILKEQKSLQLTIVEILVLSFQITSPGHYIITLFQLRPIDSLGFQLKPYTA